MLIKYLSPGDSLGAGWRPGHRRKIWSSTAINFVRCQSPDSVERSCFTGFATEASGLFLVLVDMSSWLCTQVCLCSQIGLQAACPACPFFHSVGSEACLDCLCLGLPVSAVCEGLGTAGLTGLGSWSVVRAAFRRILFRNKSYTVLQVSPHHLSSNGKGFFSPSSFLMPEL